MSGSWALYYANFRIKMLLVSLWRNFLLGEKRKPKCEQRLYVDTMATKVISMLACKTKYFCPFNSRVNLQIFPSFYLPFWDWEVGHLTHTSISIRSPEAKHMLAHCHEAHLSWGFCCFAIKFWSHSDCELCPLLVAEPRAG